MTATIESMAREAGFPAHAEGSCNSLRLTRFAELVRADERERCARVCDGIADVALCSAVGATARAGSKAAETCAAAIRALEVKQ